jgi:hypothetical protein
MEPVLVRLTRAEHLGADSPPAVRRNEGAVHKPRGAKSSVAVGLELCELTAQHVAVRDESVDEVHKSGNDSGANAASSSRKGGDCPGQGHWPSRPPDALMTTLLKQPNHATWSLTEPRSSRSACNQSSISCPCWQPRAQYSSNALWAIWWSGRFTD